DGAAIVAHFLPEEIKAVLNLRDLRLLGREFQASFAQEGLHQWFHLMLQEFLRTPSDDESSSPGEFHPQALTEPDGSLATHPALLPRPGPPLPAKFLPIAGLTRRDD